MMKPPIDGTDGHKKKEGISLLPSFVFVFLLLLHVLVVVLPMVILRRAEQLLSATSSLFFAFKNDVEKY